MNCFELDGSLWAAAICGDMVLTIVVMVIFYKCAKKRTSAGLPHTPKGTNVGPPTGRTGPVYTLHGLFSLSLHEFSAPVFQVVLI